MADCGYVFTPHIGRSFFSVVLITDSHYKSVRLISVSGKDGTYLDTKNKCPGVLVQPAVIWRNGPSVGQSHIVINGATLK